MDHHRRRPFYIPFFPFLYSLPLNISFKLSCSDGFSLFEPGFDSGQSHPLLHRTRSILAFFERNPSLRTFRLWRPSLGIFRNRSTCATRRRFYNLFERARRNTSDCVRKASSYEEASFPLALYSSTDRFLGKILLRLRDTERFSSSTRRFLSPSHNTSRLFNLYEIWFAELHQFRVLFGLG